MGHGELWRGEAVEEWCGEVSFGMARRGGSRRLGCGMARWVEVGSGTAVLVRCGEARRGRSGLGKARRLWSVGAWFGGVR